MTLTDILKSTAEKGLIPPSREKDLKTSIRYLAKALGHDGPEHCHDEDFLLPAPLWKSRLDGYFAALQTPPSPHTVRNTRNNVSFLFRQAAALGIIRPHSLLPLLQPHRDNHVKQYRLTSPYRHRYIGHGKYALSIDHWPVDIRNRFEAFRASRTRKVRDITLTQRRRALEQLLGFYANIERTPVVEWDDLFDPATVNRFVHWHCETASVRMTTTAWHVAISVKTIARYTKHARAQALTEYCHDLPTPEVLHDKRHHWLTLRELEQVALSELKDARKPLTNSAKHNKIPGLNRALQFQRALMLRLLIRIPLRQRCLREIRLPRNLFKDRRDHWCLEFKGEDLKVASKNGRTNIFHVDLTDYCGDLIPQLEEFLTTYRPIIPHSGTNPILFLNKNGKLYDREGIRKELSACTIRRLNKHFYPHLVRTIWATEFIQRTGDFTTAAYMLNDRVETVLKRYQEILEKDHQQKAHVFMQHILGPGVHNMYT